MVTNGMGNIVKELLLVLEIEFGMQLMNNVFAKIDFIGVDMLAYQFQHV